MGMQGDVLCKIEERNFIDHGEKFVVLVAKPCDCGAPAAIIRQGPTSQTGFSISYECSDCAEALQNELNNYYSAMDVEDCVAPSGKTYLVQEAQVDRPDFRWCQKFPSLRSAVSFLRAISARSAPFGGLTPNIGVREVDAATAFQQVAQYREWRKKKNFSHEKQNVYQYRPRHQPAPTRPSPSESVEARQEVPVRHGAYVPPPTSGGGQRLVAMADNAMTQAEKESMQSEIGALALQRLVGDDFGSERAPE